MQKWNVAIIGAHGQLGTALIERMEKSHLDITLTLISQNADDKMRRFKGKNIEFQSMVDISNWAEFQLVFFVATSDLAAKFIPTIAESGAVVIDATGSYSADYSIPLILPKVNDSLLVEARNQNIISIPNPIVTQLLYSLSALADLNQLQQINVTSLLPASLFGKVGLDELANQSARLLNGQPAEHTIFGEQLAFNLLFNHPRTEWNNESIVFQIQRIINNEQLLINLENIVVPIFYGLTQNVSFSSSDTFFELEPARLSQYGVCYSETEQMTPVKLNQNSDDEINYLIYLNKWQQNAFSPDFKQFVSVSDNLQMLGANTLVELAELYLEQYY